MSKAIKQHMSVKGNAFGFDFDDLLEKADKVDEIKKDLETLCGLEGAQESAENFWKALSIYTQHIHWLLRKNEELENRLGEIEFKACGIIKQNTKMTDAENLALCKKLMDGLR